MIKQALALGLFALAAAPVLADPDKDESGKERHFGNRGDREEDHRWRDRDDADWSDRNSDPEIGAMR